MSSILAVCTVHRKRDVIAPQAWWVILDCGHWYKWTGEFRPHTGHEFPCSYCGMATVKAEEGS